MNEIKTLLSLELRSFYGINKFLHTKDQKERKRYKGLIIAWVVIIGMAFFYIGGLVFGLCSFGLSEIAPAYLAIIASFMILFFGLFSSGSRIFGQRGYDILASMPLKSSSIVISRFLGLYIADLTVALLVMLPGIAVYGYQMQPNISFYLLALIGTIFIPAIPLTISILFGTLIMAAASRMKRKSMMQSLLSVFLVIGIMLGSFGMEGMTENLTSEQFLNLAKFIGGTFNKVYPPAMWLNSAMVELNALKLILFVLSSAAVIGVTLLIAVKTFHSLVRRLQNFTAKHNYKMGKMASRSLLKALYFREAKRYFSSSIYVTNTIIGPILGTIMSVALCIVGIDSIKASLPIYIDIVGLLPFVLSAVFCMMTTSSVSISMEGKQFSIIKSLPIPAKTLFDSKILLNLSIMLPFYIVSEVALAIAIKMSALELLFMTVIPASIMVLVVVLGITVNLKFHSFDWEQEVAVVKQSLPSALGGFAGFFISIIFGVAVFFIPPQFGAVAKIAICLILWSITSLLYKRNNQKNLVSV